MFKTLGQCLSQTLTKSCLCSGFSPPFKLCPAIHHMIRKAGFLLADSSRIVSFQDKFSGAVSTGYWLWYWVVLYL
jgi:hypothetical protein